MSERGYFAFRYAIPGYTFMLIVIAFNHIPLLNFLGTTEVGQVFGAIVGLLSLLAGSALGFLISQIWFWWFLRKRSQGPGVYGIKELKQADKTFMEKLRKLGLLKEVESNKEVLLAISDYIFHRESEVFLGIIYRRWDFYHVLSSTLITLPIGLAVAIGCRIYAEIFLFKATFGLPSFEVLLQRITGGEAVALMIIFVFVCFFVLLFHKIRRRFIVEYSPMVEAVILKTEVKKRELQKVFPKYFAKTKRQKVANANN